MEYTTYHEGPSGYFAKRTPLRYQLHEETCENRSELTDEGLCSFCVELVMAECKEHHQNRGVVLNENMSYWLDQGYDSNHQIRQLAEQYYERNAKLLTMVDEFLVGSIRLRKQFLRKFDDQKDMEDSNAFKVKLEALFFEIRQQRALILDFKTQAKFPAVRKCDLPSMKVYHYLQTLSDEIRNFIELIQARLGGPGHDQLTLAEDTQRRRQRDLRPFAPWFVREQAIWEQALRERATREQATMAHSSLTGESDSEMQQLLMDFGQRLSLGRQSTTGLDESDPDMRQQWANASRRLSLKTHDMQSRSIDHVLGIDNQMLLIDQMLFDEDEEG